MNNDKKMTLYLVLFAIVWAAIVLICLASLP